jgi:hypothetical protein
MTYRNSLSNVILAKNSDYKALNERFPGFYDLIALRFAQTDPADRPLLGFSDTSNYITVERCMLVNTHLQAVRTRFILILTLALALVFHDRGRVGGV